jgi:hypothetical protein
MKNFKRTEEDLQDLAVNLMFLSIVAPCEGLQEAVRAVKDCVEVLRIYNKAHKVTAMEELTSQKPCLN